MPPSATLCVKVPEVSGLDKSLNERLDCAQVVRDSLSSFLQLEEISQILGIAVPTVKRHWRYARAWLHKEMRQDV